MAAVNIQFPGNLAQVETAADLRGIPSSLIPAGTLYLVTGLGGVFEFDSGSTAADDGADVLRPYDRSMLEAGRWVKNADGLARGPAGDTGSADNTYTTYAELLASDPTRKSARLVPEAGETEPAGNFSYINGAWVRQGASGISYQEPGSLQALDAQAKLATVGVSPEGYGAIGDAVADDTVALQLALDNGQSVRLTPGKTYLLKSKLTIATEGLTLTGGGRIKIAENFSSVADTDVNGTHVRAIFVNAANVTINGVSFDATGAPMGSAVENGFIWSTSPSTTVSNCQFVGLGKGTCVWGLANAPYMSFIGNQVRGCSGAVFVKGRNCAIANNIIINATDAAIAINGTSCVGTTVTGNSIANEVLETIPSMIAVEEGASHWTIADNSLLGANGGGIVAINVLDATQVKGGTITGNVVNGANFNGNRGTTVNPAALLSISDTYLDCIITGNLLRNPPEGNSNSRAAIIPASGTVFADNIVDGSATSGISALIGIFSSNAGIDIRDNRSNAADGVRHFLFSPGSYGNAPCTFSGGKLYGGSEGINSELNAGSISSFALRITDIADTNITNLTNAATAIGDRSAFLNAGAWMYPHRIGARTMMHCTATPSAAGALPYQPGDKFFYLNPASGGYIGTVRAATSWKDFGAIV